ncbi:MAG: hypothetical protein L3J38_05710, partial [Thiomicrorhabdus sp.]|nr:hypothetical protein [Thiomicrorhabdus sp.]
LFSWQDAEGVWGALIEPSLCLSNRTAETTPRVVKIRGEENKLPSAKQLSELHLWLAEGCNHQR